MYFKVKEPWNTEKFLSSRCSRMVKHFDLGVSLLVVSPLKLFLFSFVSLFFFLLHKRVCVYVCVCGGGGGGGK